jgi:hypothetical protein
MSLPAEMTTALEQDGQPTALTVPEAVAVPVAPETVLAAIHRDCLSDPLGYLDEVRVPFGGE